jgi:hypothetical protein
MNSRYCGYWAASLLTALLCGGCSTSEPAPPPPSDRLVFVEIHDRTPLEIAKATSEVFRRAGYTAVPLPPNKDHGLMFEKKGTSRDFMLYGAWSGSVWYRVRLNIKTLEDKHHVLECDVFRVADHGDIRFEEETRVSMTRKPYQALLDQIKTELNPASGGTNAPASSGS